MEKIKLEIVGLSYSQTQSGAYALVLGEAKGKRRLPIIIGGFEAQAIAIELEKMTPTRPLTHDLFKNFAESFKITIDEVVIYNLVEGIFYSKLICKHNGDTVEIDARTSDAIALAVRFECNIYTFENILSSAGILLDEDGELPSSDIDETVVAPYTEEEKEEEYSAFSAEDLEIKLQEAINNEDYEGASKIRDELNTRNKN